MLCEIITHPYANFNDGGFTKPLLRLRYGWIITSYRKLCNVIITYPCPNYLLHSEHYSPRLVRDNVAEFAGSVWKRKRIMTSSNGNVSALLALCARNSSVTGEFPTKKASDAKLWCFLWSSPWISGWVKYHEVGDLRQHRAHYDVIVMCWGVGATKPIVWVPLLSRNSD